MTTLSESDQALCEAFVDGLLSPDKQRSFERRLASDPRLASAVRRMVSEDEALRRLHEADGLDERRVRAVKPWVWTASIAAGISLLGVLFIEAATNGGAPPFEAGLARSFDSATEYIDSVPALRGMRPPGVDALHGGTESTNIGATEFHVEATSAEQALIAQATATELDVDAFVIGIDLSGAAEVLVVAVPKFGEIEVLYPPFSNGQGARLPAGRHLLPGPRFDFAGERMRYRPGFQLPVGAGAFDLLLAVRSRSRGPVDLGSFADRLPVEQVTKALEDEGFEVCPMRVREPKD